jgi:Bifunctional DNA primase/polymerase, N-terminal/Primase C terminal 2 (PriCT-2)
MRLFYFSTRSRTGDYKVTDNPKTTLEWRLNYASRGWLTFPAPRGEKKSHKSAEHSNGRRWGATTDPDEIRRDCARWPNANTGIATGSESRIWVLEVDTPKGHGVDGIASLLALEDKHGRLPKTLMAESPSGSLHYYFNWPGDREIRNTTSAIAPGIDVRGAGGMVIAPPSVRNDGEYKWIGNEPVADAPQWLIEMAIAASGASSSERAPGDEPEANLETVEEALRVIPNNDLGWEDYNRIGMATYRATGGRGFAAFDKWAQKSRKYDAANTIDRWHQYSRSPPDRIGAATIFYLAEEAQPDWRDAHYARVMAEAEARGIDDGTLLMAELEAAAAKNEQVKIETPPANGGGIPFMITIAMRQKLRERGLTDDQIFNLNATRGARNPSRHGGRAKQDRAAKEGRNAAAREVARGDPSDRHLQLGQRVRARAGVGRAKSRPGREGHAVLRRGGRGQEPHSTAPVRRPRSRARLARRHTAPGTGDIHRRRR